MHALGYRCITAIDISATAIAHMQASEQDKEGVECKRLSTQEVWCMSNGDSRMVEHGSWQNSSGVVRLAICRIMATLRGTLQLEVAA